MRPTSWLLLLTVFLSGCSMDRADFIAEYAVAYCDWLEGCAKIKTIHGTYDACIKQKEIDVTETFVPVEDDCSFDEDKASECVEAFEDIGCEPAQADIAACREISDCYQSVADQDQTAQ